MADVHLAVPTNSKACLLAALPSCKIFDPMTIFTSEEDVVGVVDGSASGRRGTQSASSGEETVTTAWNSFASCWRVSSPGRQLTRLKTPCLDGWLEATKGASAAVDKLESHLEVSATTAAGASAPASPLSGKAARGADGPPTRSY